MPSITGLIDCCAALLANHWNEWTKNLRRGDVQNHGSVCALIKSVQRTSKNSFKHAQEEGVGGNANNFCVSPAPSKGTRIEPRDQAHSLVPHRGHSTSKRSTVLGSSSPPNRGPASLQASNPLGAEARLGTLRHKPGPMGAKLTVQYQWAECSIP